jgi:hypothetical protein
MIVHKDIAAAAGLMIVIAAVMAWWGGPEKRNAVPPVGRLPLYPITDARHLTDWSGLSGGTTIGAKPVKTIVVHPSTAPALPWPAP